MEKNKKSSLLLSTLVLDDSRVTEIVKKKEGKMVSNPVILSPEENAMAGQKQWIKNMPRKS